MLKCGNVSVNTEGFRCPALPEGGAKQSGFGRDPGREGLDGYLESKTV
ncbi:aldehyde dehydrogenase family protein [Pseudomonas frederiksbergensis]